MSVFNVLKIVSRTSILPDVYDPYEGDEGSDVERSAGCRRGFRVLRTRKRTNSA